MKIRKFLFILILITFISFPVFAMEIISNHMKIKLPSFIIKNVTVMNPNSISILTQHRLLVYTMSHLESKSANQGISFLAIPSTYPKYGESFLTSWKENIISKNNSIIYSKIVPSKNGVLFILKPEEGRYYIWCDFIKDDYCFSITCLGTKDFDSTLDMGMYLFDTVSHYDFY